MENNKKYTTLPNWLVIIIAATMLIFVFVIFAQYLKIIDLDNKTSVPFSEMYYSDILHKGDSIKTDDGFTITFMSANLRNAKLLRSGGQYTGISPQNKILCLSVLVKNDNDNLSSYYHFARCIINGKLMKSVEQKVNYILDDDIIYGKNIVTGKMYDQELPDNENVYYNGWLDKNSTCRLDMFFSIPNSIKDINNAIVEFEYFHDTSQESFLSKQQKGSAIDYLYLVCGE